MCPAEQCKDEEGNWTKFVVERLEEEERKAFEECKLLCKGDKRTDFLTDNHIIRFLAGFKFDLNGAF